MSYLPPYLTCPPPRPPRLVQRREAVARFQSDPAVRVALLSITAAAVGLDFSTAQAGPILDQ